VAKCRSCPAAIDDYSAVKNVRRPNNKFPMDVRTTNIIIIIIIIIVVEYILRARENGRPRTAAAGFPGCRARMQLKFVADPERVDPVWNAPLMGNKVGFITIISVYTTAAKREKIYYVYYNIIDQNNNDDNDNNITRHNGNLRVEPDEPNAAEKRSSGRANDSRCHLESFAIVAVSLSPSP